MKSDEQLMLEFQAGSTQSFEELFERYRHSVYGFFRRRLDSVARAEELAQETFLVIVRGTEKYEPRAKFKTYMYAIAIKELWTERRRQIRERNASRAPEEASFGTDPTTSLWVRDALDQLDPDHREVLMLREYEQLSYDEIAETLAVPVNTVRSRLSRARAGLKALLAAQPLRGV